MKEMEFIPGDNDCIEMLHQNRGCYPGGEQLILMNRDQALKLVKAAARKPVHEVTREEAMFEVAQIAAPLMIGATWALGAAEGLADPVFTAVITAVCGLWCYVNYKRRNMNG